MGERPSLGPLLIELGYMPECEAASGLGISELTLVEYRKKGIGPTHTELARDIIYHRDVIADWLRAGGTRAVERHPQATRRRA
jgi:hypothetical protein